MGRSADGTWPINRSQALHDSQSSLTMVSQSSVLMKMQCLKTNGNFPIPAELLAELRVTPPCRSPSSCRRRIPRRKAQSIASKVSFDKFLDGANTYEVSIGYGCQAMRNQMLWKPTILCRQHFSTADTEMKCVQQLSNISQSTVTPTTSNV